MHRTMSRKSFQSFRHLDKIFYFLIIFTHLAQFRIYLQRFFNRHLRLLRYHLRNRIDKSIRHIHHTPHISNHTSCRQRSECHDLNNSVFSVFSHNIVDHFLSAFITKVNVDIGHGNTFGIQKTLEQKLISDRIDRRNSQAVGNNTSRCRPPARSDCDPMIFRIFYKIPHDQEIVYIPHIFDRAQFIIKPFPKFIRPFCIAFLKSFVTQFP